MGFFIGIFIKRSVVILDKPAQNLPKKHIVSFYKWIYAGLALLLQIALIIYIVLCFDGIYALYFILTFELIAIIMSFIIAWRDDNPSYKISWIITLFILPVFGVILYFFIGKARIPKKWRMHIKQISKHTDNLYPIDFEDNCLKLTEEYPYTLRQAAYLIKTGSFRLYKNTDVKYFETGTQKYHALLDELKKAQKFIFLEYFIISEGEMWDTIYKILCQKAEQGVDVRIIYDDMGCFTTLKRDFCERLRRHGIKVYPFNPTIPLLNCFYVSYRDHRKIAVIDGNVGFTGGINLADEYINKVIAHGYWKDTAIMLKGDSVWELTRMFFQMWHLATNTMPYQDKEYIKFLPTLTNNKNNGGYIIPYGDIPTFGANNAENLYLQILSSANKYVYITSPYLIIDDAMKKALCMAAQSGIDVKIITPKIPDHSYVHIMTRYSYGVLLKNGIKIYEYQPGFIHSKTIVCDDTIASVGTVNMDFRSFYLHFECGVWICGDKSVKNVKEDFIKSLKDCKEISYEQWKKRPFYIKLCEIILNIFAPMM